ncbi:hypothetical protein [Streptomyces sp. NPDC047972]|uniref:hypothetical protein n=1 Tax=Streptomyces sp. NPDC047972 TaxID=3365493 RepID=UPI00371DF003
MDDAGVGVDAAGFDEPLVNGGGDIAPGLVGAASEVGCFEPSGGRGAVGAVLRVVGQLDDVAADAGRVGPASGGVDESGLGQADGEGDAELVPGSIGDEGAQAGGAGGDGLRSGAAGSGSSGRDEETFGPYPGAGSGSGGAAGDVGGAAIAASSAVSVIPAVWTAARTRVRAETKAAPLWRV